jgi:putative membrane protein
MSALPPSADIRQRAIPDLHYGVAESKSWQVTSASASAFLFESDEYAKQALQKSKKAEVQRFANRMIADHGSVTNQAVALAKKLKITPEDNPTSKSLKDAQDANRTKLDALSGDAFDKAYADNEAAYHKSVDDALSNTLIPDAQNAELKSLLESGLKLFQDHLRDAQNMVKQLSVAHQ